MAPKRRKSSLHPQARKPVAAANRSESVGDSLRRKYENVKAEPIPDRLQRLVDALREAEHIEKNKS
ncbi:MAG: NepR family anti-sigma factor [Henriciella sp.]